MWSRARAFAAKYGIARVHDSYEALIADPDVDAVYIPLPNALHGRWIRAALEAGKHVLVEKPFAANAAEAREIADLAASSDRVVMEALHHRYHPASVRIEQILASGELGTIQRVEAVNCYWLRDFSGSRYSYPLGGGATMDLGSYIVDTVRVYGGSTPEVVSAQAKLRGPQIDRVMTAELRFAGGHTGRLHCSMWSAEPPHYSTKVVGDRGELRLHPLTAVPAVLGSIRRRQTRREVSDARHLRVSTGCVRRGGAAWRAGEDVRGRRGREHDRHRCDLSRRRPSGSRTGLATNSAGSVLPDSQASTVRAKRSGLCIGQS